MKPSTFDWNSVRLDLISERGVEEGWEATIETAEHLATPEEAIAQILLGIGDLTAEGLQIWSSCRDRKIDIGFEGEDAKFSTTWQLEPGLVRRISDLGLALAITIYRRRISD